MKHSLHLVAAALIMGLGNLVVPAVGNDRFEVAGCFGNDMVLQRDQPITIWGRAEPRQPIMAELAGQAVATTTDANGRWQLQFAALPGGTEPLQLKVQPGKEAPPEAAITFRNLLIGDVWLLAGGRETGRLALQFPQPVPLDDSLAESFSAVTRICQLPSETATEPRETVHAAWKTLQQIEPRRRPALAAAIGLRLAAASKLPVGIVIASNPKPVECWMSQESFANTTDGPAILEYYSSDRWQVRISGSFEERKKAWLEYNQKLPLTPLPYPRPDDNVTLPQQQPAGVWNAMIAPLAGHGHQPLGLQGIIWHHGEDWDSQNRAIQQGRLLAAMIPAWRSAFASPRLPFVVVQLPPHRYAQGIGGIGIDGRLAAEFREGQIAAVTAAEASLATTIDLPVDPAPASLAERVVAVALDSRAGPTGLRGPVLEEVHQNGSTVTLRFGNTQGGLEAAGGTLSGFALAVSPSRWVWADAIIEGDAVRLSSPVVAEPQGVRYAYEDCPSRAPTLVNSQGQPANPFRTDSHPTLTGDHLDPSSPVLRFSRRRQPAIEDPRLPRVLIIGDSISGHYLERVWLLMEGKANIVGEASPSDRRPGWAGIGPKFYRADWAARGDALADYLHASGPWDIVHFNNGIHNFASAKPGAEKPYADQLRTIVGTIRASGAVCLFANSTGTVADNTIPKAPNYLTNCKAFNAAAEAVMQELGVPVTDIYGLIQPRIKELISRDLIHTNAEADQMMAELIARRLEETLATLPNQEQKTAP